MLKFLISLDNFVVILSFLFLGCILHCLEKVLFFFFFLIRLEKVLAMRI